MNECRDRCGNEIAEQPGTYRAGIQVATYDITTQDYGIQPDFNKVKQPYKNPNDKRIKQRIAAGSTGARLYDWWNVNQVKNISKVKTDHPCQMPIEVMRNIIGLLPANVVVIDPFCGSGTTGVACKQLSIPFLGFDIVPEYVEIACRRLAETVEGVKV